MPDLLDCTNALGVQALLSLDWTKMHKRITDMLLLLRRHQPSITRTTEPPLEQWRTSGGKLVIGVVYSEEVCESVSFVWNAGRISKTGFTGPRTGRYWRTAAS